LKTQHFLEPNQFNPGFFYYFLLILVISYVEAILFAEV